MISNNREDNYITKKYICPHCGNEEKFVVKKDFEDVYIIGGHNGNTYLIDSFCSKCKELNQIFVDRETKKIYTTDKEFYTAFPERYNLKRILYHLVNRIDFVRIKTKEFLETEGFKVDKEVREKIKEWSDICNFRRLEMYCLIQELIDDKSNKKYEIDIKKLIKNKSKVV